jgi:hypothetical protein
MAVDEKSPNPPRGGCLPPLAKGAAKARLKPSGGFVRLGKIQKANLDKCDKVHKLMGGT